MTLFKSVCFYILDEYLETDDKERTIQELRSVLTHGGGIEESFVSELVTHIIADLPIEDVKSVKGDDCKAVIIHSKWALISSQCDTLLPATPFESQECKLFAGVLASPSGLCRNDRDKLHALVLYYGGRFQGILNEKVSHLISIKTNSRKYQAARKYNIHVVRPEWILDCIKHNRRLPESDYSVKDPAKGLLVETISVTDSSTLFDTNESDDNEPIKKCKLVNNEKMSLAKPNNSCLDVTTVDCSLSLQEDIATPQYQLLDKIVLNTTDSVVDSCTTADKDRIASTPQPSKINPMCKDNVQHLLEGMVFMITDYSEVLDSATFSKWKDEVRKHGGEVCELYDPENCTHLLAQHKCSKLYSQACLDSICIASAHWLNDILAEQRMFPPCNPLHYPISFKETPEWCQKLSVTVTNYVGAERDLIRDMIKISGIPYTGHLCRSTTHLVCKRPEGRKYEKALEWGVNVVNSVFISDIMHNDKMPVATLERYCKLGEENEFQLSCFENNKLLHVWQQFIARYSINYPDLVDNRSCFKSISNSPLMSPEINHEFRSATSNTTRHLRLSESDCIVEDNNKVINNVVMFTGFDPATTKKYKTICKSLKMKVTSDPRICTHLIAPRVARTIKFLCAVSVSKYILSSEWIEQCDSQGKLIDEDPFILSDKESEDLFTLNIRLSLERASERKLLNNIAIHATRNVMPSYESLKLIVECAGGMLYTLSDLNTFYGRKYERLATDGRLLIVISCPTDVSAGMCSEFYQRKIPVYNAEFILTGVLRQSLSFDQNQLTRQ